MGHKGELADVIYSPASGIDDWRQRPLAAYFLKRSDARLQCYPSLDSIERDTAMPRKRIIKAIAGLERATGPVKLHVKRGCRKDGPGRAVNVYTLIVDMSAAAALKFKLDQSAASTLKYTRDLNAPVALKSTRLSGNDLSADLSVKYDRPECRNGADLSADVDPVILSENSYNEFSQPQKARARGGGGGQQNGCATKSNRKAATRKRKTPLPASFMPNGFTFYRANKLGLDDMRVLAELDKFRKGASDSALESRDWDATFRRWLRNARKTNPPEPPAVEVPEDFDLSQNEGMDSDGRRSK